MDTNIGVPSEILVLCTSAETKEKALALFEQIRQNKSAGGEMTMDAALPAVCSLIASEQLGNTVVSERRAQQWSRSTPQHFKTLKAEIKKIIYSVNNISTNTASDGLLQNLAHEFELDSVFLEYMTQVRQAFNSAIPEPRWRTQTQTVQVSIFIWICRRFKLHTKQPIDNLLHRYGIAGSDLREIHCVLNQRWPSNADITNTFTGNEPSIKFLPSGSSNIGHSSYRDNTLNPQDPTDFSQLVNDFDLDGSIADGLHHLQKAIRQTELLKNLVDWNSTLGKCTIFYWTCSVLKITGIKHIAVRTHYNVNKKDFDKLILALDGHRGDLRKSLEEFYARNVHLTDPFKSTQVNSNDRVPESSLNEDPGFHSTRRSGKRGRPRRDKSLVSPFTPVSYIEAEIAKMCDHSTYRRALLLYRSIMARPLPNSDQIPFEALPSLVVFMANEQLRNNQLTDKEIEQMSALRMNQFETALTALYSLMKGYENIGNLIAQTKFDDMALEHGLCINTVAAMISACKHLKESKCLSESMNWESPLVTCTILFWTCAILQVPDININILRKDSQASKREFDTMLQLLNNHCSGVRHGVEHDQKRGYIVSTRNIHNPKGVNSHTPQFHGQISQDSGPDERPSKISKSENLAFLNTNQNITQASDTFDEIIARQYLDIVATRTMEGGMNVPGSNKATISNVSALVREKHHLPAGGGTDLTPSSISNRKSGSDVSCAVTSGTPLGDGGIARNTRYSQQDYANIRNKLEVWVPYGLDVSERRDQYRLWEGKMVERYGSAWEQNITRYKDPGVAFE